jgi:hypothetical protein
MHLFPVLANSPGSSAAQEKNPVEFDVGTRSGVDVEIHSSGAGLGTACEGDSLARIVSSVGTNLGVDPASADSSVDSPSILTGAGEESCVDLVASQVCAWGDVRLGHESGADHSPGSSVAASGNPGISLNRCGSSTALHPDGPSSVLIPVEPSDAGSSVAVPPATSHASTRPTTQFQQGI